MSSQGHDPKKKDDQDRITPAYRPEQVEQTAPCQTKCPNHSDIRRWVGVIAQREQSGEDQATAYDRAWQIITEVNPFPSVLGRICPHPCESGCNRGAVDEPLAIHSLERFLGDRAIDRGLELQRMTVRQFPESIGVVGAGPSGLSFAYQMARRGYHVTLYEDNERLGGMLRYGIPAYRLPKSILDAEIARIVKLGVEVRSPIRIGRDLSFDELRTRHAAVYVALGAQQGRPLEIPGGAGPGVWTGAEFLLANSRGKHHDLGQTTLVVGGGNTAIDAARTARRLGSNVMIAYRRTRAEMPASPEEIDDALAEGIELMPLLSVIELERDRGGRLVAAETQRMRLDDLDDSGRGRPVPIPDSEQRVVIDSLLVAISQKPDLKGFDEVEHRGDWLLAHDGSIEGAEVLAGGDVVGLGIAGNAIVQGRLAAEHLHERFRQEATSHSTSSPTVVKPDAVKFETRSTAPRVAPKKLIASERLATPDAEVTGTVTEEAFLAEVKRCVSCGSCFGCEQCAMFCTAGCYEKLPDGSPGKYFKLSLAHCHECGKCIEVCPCGFLQNAEKAPG